MILTIIFIVLLVVGIVLAVAGRYSFSDCDVVGSACVIIASLGLVFCLGFIIAAQCNNAVYGGSFANKVGELNAEYKTLEQMSEYCNNKIITPTEMVGKVTAYNTKVSNFRAEIVKGKYYANNPWTSWCNPNFYNSYTGEEVQFYTFTSPES